MKKKYLFFIVHPSKVHLYRNTINNLIKNGHLVDILITKKDVLEDLVLEEGWDYTNIFPEGRKIKGFPTFLGALLNSIITIYRLFKYTSGKKYDLFITDDLLGIIGKIRNVKTIHFVDDDIHIFPHTSFMLYFADYILAPNCTNLGKFDHKKIGFDGYKQSAYLRPENFSPNRDILRKYSLEGQRYFIIRLVSLAASHDIGKKGITDEILDEMILLLQKHGHVYISSERQIREKWNHLMLKIDALDVLNVVSFADLFICDSQTMSAESAFLGTPDIRFNDFIGRIGVHNEIENKYKLGFGIKTSEKEKLFSVINNLLAEKDFKIGWLNKRDIMLRNTINLNSFMLDLIHSKTKKNTVSNEL